MKPALMVIDLQKAYYHGPARASMDAACEYVNAAVAAFRKKGLPIVWVQHIDEGDGSVPGAAGFEFEREGSAGGGVELSRDFLRGERGGRCPRSASATTAFILLTTGRSAAN